MYCTHCGNEVEHAPEDNPAVAAIDTELEIARVNAERDVTIARVAAGAEKHVADVAAEAQVESTEVQADAVAEVLASGEGDDQGSEVPAGIIIDNSSESEPEPETTDLPEPEHDAGPPDDEPKKHSGYGNPLFFG
jgi:hypothetical protein